jgi:DNA repair protein RadC
MKHYLRTIEYKFKPELICETETPLKKYIISSKEGTELAVEYFYNLQDEVVEKFIVLYMDAKKKIICFKVLFTGDSSSSAVYPTEIFRVALLCGAVTFICIHNHPSGDPAPSESDRELTREIIKAGNIMRIKMLDHIIIGEKKKYWSFAEHNQV